MKSRNAWRLALGAVLASVLFAFIASPAEAQGAKRTREGFWLSVGLGAGSLGCDECDGRETGLSGQLALGGTLSQRVLLGVGTNGWTKSQDGVTITMGSLTALVRFYPSETGNFFFTGGLGIARLDLGIDGYGSGGTNGTGAMLGIGYDARIGQRVSITPFWNGVGGSFDGGNANFGQIGVGVTWH